MHRAPATKKWNLTVTENSTMKILILVVELPSSTMHPVLEGTRESVQLPLAAFWAISPEISSLAGFQHSQLDTLFHPEQDNITRAGKDLLKKWALGTGLHSKRLRTHLRLSQLDLPDLKDLQTIGPFSHPISHHSNSRRSVSLKEYFRLHQLQEDGVVTWEDRTVHGAPRLSLWII